MRTSRSLAALSTYMIRSHGRISALINSEPLHGPLTKWRGGPRTRLRAHSTSSMDDEEKETSSLKKYSFQGSMSEISQSGVTVSFFHHTVSTDLPVRQGGKDTAPQPVELLLGAWAGCTLATARFVGRNLPGGRVQVVDMDFDVTAVRDERGALTLPIDQVPPVPSRLLRLEGKIAVTTKPASITDEQFRLLRDQTELRCPVANMLIASGCQVDVEWERLA